jgi:hypothetical protein
MRPSQKQKPADLRKDLAPFLIAAALTMLLSASRLICEKTLLHS